MLIISVVCPPKKYIIIIIIMNICIIGCDIFDELCLRIDVNQKYAELLPQWKDVAHQLEIDQLMTKWVEVCVRPKEGLARAMLEIYMKDGGKYTVLTYLFKKIIPMTTKYYSLRLICISRHNWRSS